MREILFRGKSIRGSDWEYGYVIMSDDGKKATIYEPQDAEFNAWCVFPHGVLPDTVGQFTGLLDKNGNKIFEGDIIKDKYNHVWLVTFERGAFCISNGHRSGTLFEPYSVDEIIGNKWDNPELLNEDVRDGT